MSEGFFGRQRGIDPMALLDLSADGKHILVTAVVGNHRIRMATIRVAWWRPWASVELCDWIRGIMPTTVVIGPSMAANRRAARMASKTVREMLP